MTETDLPEGFGPSNLPYGVDDGGNVVVAYGKYVLDLARLDGLDVGPEIWSSGSLNAFMALGSEAWRRTREQIQHRLVDHSLSLSSMRRMSDIRLVLPFDVADYVDFYASEEHATAMGRLLRPAEDPLPPAWRHIPIGYHGRSATVVVSGEPIPRPAGMRATDTGPTYGLSQRLDVEVECGAVVGVGNVRGVPIPVERAKEHIFGVVLLNDWSARDIQTFEYRPLGPFLGKSFATSISPWVVPLDALSPFWVNGPLQKPAPVPYLRAPEPRGLDINLELCINDTVLSTTSTRNLYWSICQQLAHITANGAVARTGDLFASGTVSGWGPQTAGSLMELTSGGNEPLILKDGSYRTWLEDQDTAIIRGWCGERGRGQWLSLSEVRGTIEPGSEGER